MNKKKLEMYHPQYLMPCQSIEGAHATNDIAIDIIILIGKILCLLNICKFVVHLNINFLCLL